MKRLARILLWVALGVAGLNFCTASANCVDVVDVDTELPHQITTPNQTQLSYFYNLDKEEYVVVLSRDGKRTAPYGPLVLTRSCSPAKLRWESNKFVVLEEACGTFCWNALVLPLPSNTSGFQIISRPLIFDTERNLLVSYADKDTIRVTSLATGYRQQIPTARTCESASEICFDVQLDTDKLMYTWRYEPMETYSVKLDKEIFH